MIKSTLLTLALAGASFAASAQVTVVDVNTNRSEPSDLKPVAGSNNLELLINPFTSDPLRLFDGIKYRRFTDPTTAIRAVVNLYYSHSNKVTQDASGGNPELHTIDNNFGITLRPGIEKHLAGTRRLSPYFGGELLVGFNTTSRTVEDQDLNGSVVKTDVSNQDGYLRLGVNGLAGVDIYLAQSFYMGTELGFGIAYTSNFDTKVTPPGGSSQSSRLGKTDGFSIGPYVIPAIRVGYIW